MMQVFRICNSSLSFFVYVSAEAISRTAPEAKEHLNLIDKPPDLKGEFWIKYVFAWADKH